MDWANECDNEFLNVEVIWRIYADGVSREITVVEDFFGIQVFDNSKIGRSLNCWIDHSVPRKKKKNKFINRTQVVILFYPVIPRTLANNFLFFFPLPFLPRRVHFPPPHLSTK